MSAARSDFPQATATLRPCFSAPPWQRSLPNVTAFCCRGSWPLFPTGAADQNMALAATPHAESASRVRRWTYFPYLHVRPEPTDTVSRLPIPSENRATPRTSWSTAETSDNFEAISYFRFLKTGFRRIRPHRRSRSLMGMRRWKNGGSAQFVMPSKVGRFQTTNLGSELPAQRACLETTWPKVQVIMWLTAPVDGHEDGHQFGLLDESI